MNPQFAVPNDVENGWNGILRQFLTDDLLRQLCDWTNSRVEQEVVKFHEENEDEELPYGLATWKQCTVFDMMKVIGILLYTGVVQKPELTSYWSTDPFYYNPFFPRQDLSSSGPLPADHLVVPLLRLSGFQCE